MIIVMIIVLGDGGLERSQEKVEWDLVGVDLVATKGNGWLD